MIANSVAPPILEFKSEKEISRLKRIVESLATRPPLCVRVFLEEIPRNNCEIDNNDDIKSEKNQN